MSNIIADRIKKRRQDLGITQADLAERCGYKSKVSISRIELGKQDVPLDKLEIIARELYTTSSYLQGWDDSVDKLTSVDDGVAKYLDMLHKDPQYKVLLDSTSKLNVESVKKLISFIKTLE